MSDELTAEELLDLNDPSVPAPPPARKAKVKEEPAAERLHPVLSNEEVLSARAEARKLLEEERKAAARKALVAQETERLRVEEGLVTGDGVKDEMVTVTLDLADHSEKITLSGTPYYHNQTYTVPRHVADTLREIQFRGHQHQNEIDGKPMSELFRRPHITGLSPIKGVTNAPQPVAA